jgi:hypothetical protein
MHHNQHLSLNSEDLEVSDTEIEYEEKSNTAITPLLTKRQSPTESYSIRHFPIFHTLSSEFAAIIALFKHRGLIHTVCAFATAEATINALSAFFPFILLPRGCSQSFTGLMASLFIFMCMSGSALIGYIVDQTKLYKRAMIVCFIGSSISLLAFNTHVGESPIETQIWTTITVAFMGFFIGPIQPIAIESGVEITFPATSPSTVTGIQQVLGNIVSALSFPVFESLRDPITKSADAAVFCLICVQISLIFIYSTFNGTYARLNHELDAANRRPKDLLSVSGVGVGRATSAIAIEKVDRMDLDCCDRGEFDLVDESKSPSDYGSFNHHQNEIMV